MEILSGRKPLFRSSGIKQAIVDIEKEFVGLINGSRHHNQERHPAPSTDVMDAAVEADTNPLSRSFAHYSLSQTSPTRICDTRGETKRIFLTVPKVGSTVWVSHDRVRLQNVAGGFREGIPLTNAGVGEPALTTLVWQGEMWAIASADSIPIDVETS